jgi:hypothetical protein
LRNRGFLEPSIIVGKYDWTVISTRDLSSLPSVEGLKSLLRSMAMLDAILSPDWQYRYYSFNARWADGEMMGSMRNGSGDDFFALFNATGCFLKGFSHESPMASDGRVWPGIYEQVPSEFSSVVKEPAFKPDDTTFCLWRRLSDPIWQRGKILFPVGEDPDGSGSLLSPLDGRPETYQKWAEGYYEVSVDLAAVQAIYRSTPLTIELVRSLNTDLTIEDLKADIQEIGYPG